MPYILVISLVCLAAQPAGAERSSSASQPSVAPGAEADEQPPNPSAEGDLWALAGQAGALIGAGAVGPALAGGVLAAAVLGAAYSNTVGLRIIPWILLASGFFAMAAVPAGFVLTAAALARVHATRAVPAAVLAPAGGMVGALLGGGVGLLVVLVAEQAFYPEQELSGDLVGGVVQLGAVGALVLGVASGAALGGAVGGGGGAALGFGAGWATEKALADGAE